MRRHVLLAAISLALLVGLAYRARADDGPTFHRTTPRAAFEDEGGTLVVGIPGGRARGIESDLRPLPDTCSTLDVRLAVRDPMVRETFVPVAYCASGSRARASWRSRRARRCPRRAVRSSPCPSGRRPTRSRIAYGVLARLSDTDGRSASDAVSARLRALTASSRPAGSLFSRVLP